MNQQNEEPWDKDKASQLSGEHWQWFQNIAGHLTMDFFEHGYKHGWQDRERKYNEERNKAN